MALFSSYIPTRLYCGLKRVCFNLLTICLVTSLLSHEVQGKAPECATCKEIVDNFHAQLAATEKSNYGGGNTKWEEKSLGSYAFSEVRLVEIMEKLCEGKSKECHPMLEEHEDIIEHFWFKEYTQKKETDFHTFLCIDNIKACCPSNHYGAECSPCPGGKDRPCQGNGKCQGEGTRAGSGKCICYSGYQGDLCNECKDGYFETSKNDTHIDCKVCHLSCKGTCWEGGPKGCDECKDGWTQTEEDGCKDINECLEEPCEEHQYCANTQGSYTCFTCDVACQSCTDAGPSHCNSCKEGFIKLDNGTCQDKDECAEDSGLCIKDKEQCVNLPGSYECECQKGFQYNEDEQCQAVPEETDEEEKGEDRTDTTQTEKEEL